MIRYFHNQTTGVVVTHVDTNGDGDKYKQSGFTEYPNAESLPHPVAPVPAHVSKLALKYALGQDWLKVKAAIAADPALQEDWNLANLIYRDSTLMNGAAQALGYTPQQIDDIFRAAAKVVV